MAVQCVFCHRVDEGNKWVKGEPKGMVTYVACPECIEKQKQKNLEELEKTKELPKPRW